MRRQHWIYVLGLTFFAVNPEPALGIWAALGRAFQSMRALSAASALRPQLEAAQRIHRMWQERHGIAELNQLQAAKNHAEAMRAGNMQHANEWNQRIKDYTKQIDNAFKEMQKAGKDVDKIREAMGLPSLIA